MTVDEAAVYIRNNVDIVEIISRYVSLKKVGRNYFGLCPFHSEKSPSFSVNQSKGIFKCFGCGEGGDVIKFLSKIENISYREAVIRLAGEIGITVEVDARTEALFKLTEDSQKLLNTVLETKAGSLALSYLKDRGIKDETIKKFGIGYDPARDFLQKGLTKRGYKLDMLRAAGLINSSGNDFFAYRVVFPIDNMSKRVVGFGGRSLDNNNPIKYLNTGETPLFKKSRVLYGLRQALPIIDKSKSVILVEGYFDTVVLSQEGFMNVVGILGTSVSPEQSRLLSRRVRRAILLLDADDAGITAALKGCFALLSQNVEPVVGILPEGLDPDETALRYKDKLMDILNAPMNLVPFISFVATKYFKGIRSPEFLEVLSQNLRGLSTSPLLEMALKEISEAMGVEPRTLLGFVSMKSNSSENDFSDRSVQTQRKLSDVENIEEQMARLIANTPELSTVVMADEYFYPYTPGLKEVMDAVTKWDPEIHNAENYIDLFPDYLKDFVEESLAENFGTYEQKEKLVKELLGRWRVKDLDNFIKKLREQIEHAPSDNLLEQLQEVLKEREEVSRELQNIE
ncbi:DNA primase [Coprothermobacter platensis]|uniref:DNA primase n=1 Tax=Coprothermobacter platensis TaxID=108819 RepID=UPI00037DF742|nr:DNA primase [Coprothermobacter platensis]